MDDRIRTLGICALILILSLYVVGVVSQQTIEEFEVPSEGVLRLQFSNGDRLTVAREAGPEGFTIHHSGEPIIVG